MADLIQVMKEMASGYTVGTYEDELDAATEDFAESICDQARKENLNIFYSYGATQLCFIDENNHDYVVKMPFTYKGYCKWEEDENGEEQEEEVIDDFSYNYTEKTEEIYAKAVDAGVAMFFAGIESIGNGLWKQEYVTERAEGSSPRIDVISTEELNYINELKYENGWGPFDCTWIADCLFYYGRELFDKFICFIRKENINDLHSGNYGWTKNGYPRLLDYCGYFE